MGGRGRGRLGSAPPTSASSSWRAVTDRQPPRTTASRARLRAAARRRLGVDGSTDFAGYPGFRSFPYREYSEVFFGHEYKVLRGGSWATDPVAMRTTFRNWDYPIRRQIFAGFRCARDA